jgi:hypothetical protein
MNAQGHEEVMTEECMVGEVSLRLNQYISNRDEVPLVLENGPRSATKRH